MPHSQANQGVDRGPPEQDPLSWPAQSSDLKPTENLWNVIKKIDDHKPSNTENQGYSTKYRFLNSS